MDTEYRDRIGLSWTYGALRHQFLYWENGGRTSCDLSLWQVNAGIRKYGKVGNDRVIRAGYFRQICIEAGRGKLSPAAFYKEPDEPDGSRYFFDLSYKSWFGGERIMEA